MDAAPRLSRLERELLDLIARRADDAKGVCHATRTIAGWLHAAESTVRKALGRLCKLGLIVRAWDYGLRTRRRFFPAGQAPPPPLFPDPEGIPTATNSFGDFVTGACAGQSPAPAPVISVPPLDPPIAGSGDCLSGGLEKTLRSLAPGEGETPNDSASPEEVAGWERDAAGGPGVERWKVRHAQAALVVLRRDLEAAARPTAPPPPAVAPAPPVPVVTALPERGNTPSAEPVVETEDLLRRLIAPGSGPAAVETAARRIAERLGDHGSLAGFRCVCREIQAGALKLKPAIQAFRSALSGTARRPGAVFMAAVADWRGAHKPAPGPISPKTPGGRLLRCYAPAMSECTWRISP